MANIALTNRCNLACEYCFAHKYTTSSACDITMDSFLKALDFVKGEGEVGLIGGEPLLHKNINDILHLLVFDPQIRRVTLFTNGIYLNKVKKENIHPKIQFLVNVNSREQIGDGQFDSMKNNIKDLLYYADEERVTLGFNIYKQNQDFSDILSLLKENNLKRVRVSVVIPWDKSEGAFAYFNKMKGTLLAFCKELKEIDVSPCYDCNAIPECAYTSEEKELLSSLKYLNEHERRIFTGQASVCAPIVDIYPDLTATRCFGMSDYKVKIEDFKNISDLKNHFFYEIDTKLVHRCSKAECENCYKQSVFGCFGGCLCYK
ncbi:MAG: radical SAM protein [Clostridia bacterium]|nr:radical SAM protein [Clostridia bacterium]